MDVSDSDVEEGEGADSEKDAVTVVEVQEVVEEKEGEFGFPSSRRFDFFFADLFASFSCPVQIPLPNLSSRIP